LVFGAYLVLAAALAAQTYPHAFPRNGVTRLIRNERVVVWDVTWVRDVEQPVHRHQFDVAAAVYTLHGRFCEPGISAATVD